ANSIALMQVDLSSRESIRQFARDFDRRYERLHVLVNNAGVWMNEKRRSVDGVEMTWATNVLGYFTLTSALVEKMKASAKDGGARIVDVASVQAYGLEIDDVEYERSKNDGIKAYAQSKQ